MRRTIVACVWALLAVARIGHAAPDGRPIVAVLYFDYDGQDKDLAVLKKGLAQMLITDLSNVDSVHVVERDRLEAILGEQKLQQTAVIDPQTAVKVGKLLGARYLVFGHYMHLMGKLTVDSGVTNLETGERLPGTRVVSTPEDFLGMEQKISDHVKKILTNEAAHAMKAATPPSTSTAAPKTKPPAALKSKTAVAYSRALDAIDHKDKATAKKELTAVLKEQPDFTLAQLDLDRLVR